MEAEKKKQEEFTQAALSTQANERRLYQEKCDEVVRITKQAADDNQLAEETIGTLRKQLAEAQDNIQQLQTINAQLESDKVGLNVIIQQQISTANDLSQENQAKADQAKQAHESDVAQAKQLLQQTIESHNKTLAEQKEHEENAIEAERKIIAARDEEVANLKSELADAREKSRVDHNDWADRKQKFESNIADLDATVAEGIQLSAKQQAEIVRLSGDLSNKMSKLASFDALIVKLRQDMLTSMESIHA
jgi:DNA repair exonuclease SbcCD ATPase subunit